MTGVEVRRAEDLESIRAAERLFDRPVDDAAAIEFLSAERHHLLVAYVESEPVGMVSGVEMTHPDKGTEMFLYELGVADEHRGRGIGTALVAALRELAAQRGCYGMWVLTDSENAAALATYGNAGARHAGDQVMLEWEFQPAGRSE